MSVIITSMLCFTVFGNGQEERVASAEPEQTRPLHLLGVGSYQDDRQNEEKFIPQEVMKRTGVEFVLERVPGADYDTKLNLLMASGDTPDFFRTNSVSKFVTWVKHGVLLELDSLIDELGSNIVKYTDSQAWEYRRLNGKTYALPSGKRPEPGNGQYTTGLVVRTDWVEKLGFTERISSESFDLDDYYQMIKAMTFDDPDGNGKNDTYGLGESGVGGIFGIGGSFPHVFGAYGVAPWVMQDGKAVAGHMTDEFVDAVSLLRDWYDEGIIDPEFIVMNEQQLKEKTSRGLIGTRGGTMWWTNPQGAVSAALAEAVPGAEIEMAIPPKGPEGHRGVVATMPGGNTFFMISAETPYPRSLMKLIDFIFSEEGAMRVQYGEEGTHHIYHEEKNRIEMIPPFDKWGYFFRELGNARFIQVTDRRWAPEKVIESIAMTSKYVYRSAFYGEVPAFREYPDLSKDIDKSIVEVISGAKPVSELRAMQQRWLKNGGEEMTSQVNAAIEEAR